MVDRPYMSVALSIFLSSYFFFSRFLEITPQRADFCWKGKMPSYLLWKKFWHLGNRIPDDVFAKILSFKDLKRIAGKNLSLNQGDWILKKIRKQQLRANGDYEKFLLAKSAVTIFPHEVFQIRAIGKFGEVFSGRVFHGGIDRIGSKEMLLKEIRKLICIAKKKGASIASIEINHTHPTLEVIYHNSKKTYATFSCLSERDIQFVEEISPFLDFSLKIRAITPALNYTYTT
jgi:hypothetical protein